MKISPVRNGVTEKNFQTPSRLSRFRNDDLVSLIFGIGLLLTQFYTAPLLSNSPIRFSDLGAIFILLACALGGITLPKGSFFAWASVFVGWSVLVFFLYEVFGFSIESLNHFVNVFRILVGIFLFYMLSYGLIRTSPKSILNAINVVVMLHVIFLFFYVFLFSANIFDGFFNVVSPGDERNSLITNNNLLGAHFRTIIAAGDDFRFSGVFEEPAFFSWNLIALIACAMQISKNAEIRFSSSKLLLIFAVTTFFTRSFAGIIGGCLLALPLVWQLSLIKRLGILFGMLLLIAAMLFWGDEKLLERFDLLLSLGDGSSNSRIIGSINAFIGMLEYSPIFGFGLGDLNKEKAALLLEALGVEYCINLFDICIIDIHNILVQVAFSLGLVGMAAYVALLLPTLRAGAFYVVGMLIVFFSSNVFNAYFIWVFIGLGAYAARLRFKYLVQ